MAAAFSLTGIAVLEADTLLLLVPLRLLAGITHLAAVDATQRQAASLLALQVHGDGYDISLVFFGTYCLMLGCPVWRVGFDRGGRRPEICFHSPARTQVTKSRY